MVFDHDFVCKSILPGFAFNDGRILFQKFSSIIRGGKGIHHDEFETILFHLLCDQIQKCIITMHLHIISTKRYIRYGIVDLGFL